MNALAVSARLMARFARGHLVPLDYPVKPEPRYGYGKPPHPQISALIEARRDEIRSTVAGWAELEPAFRAIPTRASSDPRAPHWLSGWLPAIDAAALYAYVAAGSARRYVEIGSGQSTRFARRAIEDRALSTLITSIDPRPRSEIDSLCDRVVRTGLETADLDLFHELEAGDIVFLDGSHRCFTNSDVATFFLEVLPRLAPGVLVQVHDVYLPFDYPRDLAGRYYSEQYLLAVYLLAASGARVEMPSAWVSYDPELSALLRALWDRPGLETLERWGASFWFRTGA